jgi:hypothetical protein
MLSNVGSNWTSDKLGPDFGLLCMWGNNMFSKENPIYISHKGTLEQMK